MILVIWVFSLNSLFLFGVIVLKTRWFKLWSGKILITYAVAFCITALYLLGRWLGIVSEAWQLPYYVVVLGGLAVVNLANGIYLLRRNWHFWAWSEEKVGP